MIPRCRLVVPANNQSNVKSEADYVPLSQHYDEKQEGMTAAFDGNPPQLHVEEEPKSGTTTKRMTVPTPITTHAEKEDDTDSTATATTVAATATSGSEWEDHIMEDLIQTPQDQVTYVFGKRRRVKAASKWKTTNNYERQEGKQTKAINVTCTPIRPIKGVFMFGQAARSATTINSMPTLQESNHQEPVEKQKENRRRKKNRAKIGKFKVTTKKPGKLGNQDIPANKKNQANLKQNKKTPFKLRDEELELRRNRLSTRRKLNWNKKQQKQNEELAEVREVKKTLQEVKVRIIKNRSSRNITRTTAKQGKKRTCKATRQNEEEDKMNSPHLNKNQQTSSAVRFARHKSNRRYKPGD